MVMATAVVHGNEKTARMMTFTADEQPRSLQVYGSDPVMLGEAIRRLCAADRVDHIDMNFGCPAAKVTRKGGGAAVPAKPNLLRAILRSAVAAAQPYGVPVTLFRKGLTTRSHPPPPHRRRGGCHAIAPTPASSSTTPRG
jgi:tRNA-dihydrouridine synthase